MSTISRTAGPSTRAVGPLTSQVGPSAIRAAVQAHLALRFALELVAYAALGYWGSSVSHFTALHVALAIAVPAAALLTWARFLAPKARRLAGLGGLCLELVVFLAAAAAAAASVSLTSGLVLGAVATANALTMRALGALQ